jgi:GNAT superfamily N-acetyltransferase
MIKIRSACDGDHQGILDLVASLPEWFAGDPTDRAIPIDIRFNDCFVAEHDGTIVGFATIHVGDGRLNIGWMGVQRDLQRQGIGSRLLGAVEQAARSMGLREIATVTVGEGADCPAFEATRSFYISHGFTVFQSSTTDNPECPEEIKLKKQVARSGVPGDLGQRA